MKTLLITLIALVTLNSCTQQKIAYVDSSELLKEYKVMKEFEEEMKAKEVVFTDKYKKMQGEIEAEYQDFMAKASKMNKKKAEALNQQINQKYQQMQQMQQGEGLQLQQEGQTKMTEILKEITDFVKDYGKTNGYTFILGSSESTGSVLYGEEKLDITEAVLTALNTVDKKEEVKEEATEEATETTKEAVKLEETKTEETPKK